jgi:hypothetical protein
VTISTKIVAGVVAGFLVSATYGPAFAQSHDARDARGISSDATIPCDPLSWDAANKLPRFIKASQVECMSPTQDDLQARIKARGLLLKAATQMNSYRTVSGSSADGEYNQGIVAYAAGRYIEAISHLQAVISSANP